MIRVISPYGIIENKEAVDARECVDLLGYRYAEDDSEESLKPPKDAEDDSEESLKPPKASRSK